VANANCASLSGHPGEFGGLALDRRLLKKKPQGSEYLGGVA
jgi:hypothetical protein